ncbi:MAG: DUF4331 family protein [Candidatus Baltobacteraceae bacterium]
MTLRRIFGSVGTVVALTAAVILYASHPVRGSDHQDSPTVVSRPPADITDIYVFPSPANANNVVFVMNVDPLIPAGATSGKYFDPSVLYQFKIAHGPAGTTNPEDEVIQLTAGAPTGSGTQTLTLYGPGKPNATGTDSTLLTSTGTFAYNATGTGATLPNGIQAFAGPRADPFFFDLFQFFTILPDRLYSNPRTGNTLGLPMPTFNGFTASTTSGPSGSGYACSTTPATNALTQLGGGFNVLSIVLEMPKSLFIGSSSGSLIHVWGTTSTVSGS